ncbi:MAG: permease-like cell division protein FtsX [Bacteroidota bacterium]|jgi:cell division transport system permease protein|nr:permease-like cell division protein FtsX [Bacteroidota bacterium]
MSNSAKTAKKKFFNLHFTVTVSISLVLFLIGFIALLLMVGKDVSNYVKENVNMSVVLEDSISPANRFALEKAVKAMPATKSYDYISKDQALKDHIRDLGENPQDFLGYNPLLASYEVKLKSDYANPDSASKMETQLKQFLGVKQVMYQKDIVHLVNNNIQKTGFILSGVALILLFVSIVLLNNTIRISIYSKRFLINTMKLVGAKAWFIRRPFILKSLLNGLTAALLALVMLAGAVYYLQYEIGATFNLYRLDVLVIVGGLVILFALIITFFASLFAVNRYIRMRTDSYYFV